MDSSKIPMIRLNIQHAGIFTLFFNIFCKLLEKKILIDCFGGFLLNCFVLF